MKKIFSILLPLAFLMVWLGIATPVSADTGYKTVVYFFWGDGCPHCANEKPFLEELKGTYPALEVKSYETWYNKDNAQLFEKMSKAYGSDAGGVPTTFIGDFDPVIGYGTANTTGRDIEEYVSYCVQNGCIDPGSLIGLTPVSDPPVQNNANRPDLSTGRVVTLPVIGEIDVSQTGLLIFTVFIGILDGFNACAMWVLCFLLSLLVYSQSRKRIILIGGTFIFVSGFMYYLFIAGWLSLFLFAGSLRVIQLGIAALAIGFGLVSIKDYFWFGKGISFIIPQESKKKIIKRMRGLVHPSTQLGAAMLGVAALAIGVNVVELLCSLGLPAVYTGVLNTYNYPPIVKYLYLLVYIVFYMIDDFIIFLVVIKTLSHKKFTEKYGRISKLISGLVILALGIIMIVDPSLLSF